MRSVFADTFYWAALTSPGDAAHELALNLSRSVPPDRIVTTDEVLAEYLAFFARGRASVRIRAASNVAAMMANPRVLVVPQSRESFLAGLELYRARPDKGSAW